MSVIKAQDLLFCLLGCDYGFIMINLSSMQRNTFMEDLNEPLRGPFQWQVQNYPGFSLPKFAKLGRSFQEVKVMYIECIR